MRKLFAKDYSGLVRMCVYGCGCCVCGWCVWHVAESETEIAALGKANCG